jgi:purine-nucleoside phosphorylase
LHTDLQGRRKLTNTKREIFFVRIEKEISTMSLTNGNAIHYNGIDKHGPSDLDKKLLEIREASDFLLAHCCHRPKIAIICGTGLGGLADLVEDAIILSYSEIPHFTTSSVPGHAGKLIFGKLSGKRVVCMQGRIHTYEGHSMWKMTFPVRVFAAMGANILLATNACGGINRKMSEGDVMVMKDHINLPGLAGLNPLIGLNDTRFGPRFQELTTAYDKGLRKLVAAVAQKLDMNFVKEGVYCFQSGPFFETIAELVMMKNMGADAAGMSTVPEVMVGRHCGMRCLGISLVTNMAIDSYESVDYPDHAETLKAGDNRAADLKRLFAALVAEIEN